MGSQETQIAISKTLNKNKVGGFTFAGFKIYYKTTIVKTV